MSDRPAADEPSIRGAKADQAAFIDAMEVASRHAAAKVVATSIFASRFRGAEMGVLALIVDFATARAIRRSIKPSAQEPEPLFPSPGRSLPARTRYSWGSD